MYITFNNRTYTQLLVVWQYLYDRYKCRIDCIKKLVNGLYSGYLFVNREISDTGKWTSAKKLVDIITTERSAMIRAINGNNDICRISRDKSNIRRHYNIPAHKITVEMMQISRTRSKLIKDVKNGK